MWGFFRKEKKTNTLSFATSCWEKDWRQILLNEEYLQKKMIENHCGSFREKILIINNVDDEDLVSFHAKKLKEKNILTQVYLSRYTEKEVLDFFQLKRSDFRIGEDASSYENVTPDWIYYNALAPLSAIYLAKSDFLLYMTGDVYLDQPIAWTDQAMEKMQKRTSYKVANLSWNGNYAEARKESFRKDGDFFVAKSGFSDQMFLVATKDFRQPIYGEIRSDAAHFPRGDVFEKRVYSFMKNHGWQRIIYSRGSYIHKSF